MAEASNLVVRGGEVSFNGGFGLERFVALTTISAARLNGLYSRKGTIAIGANADLVLWDPAREVTIRQSELKGVADYSRHEGMRLHGWPVTTIARGDIVCRERELRRAGGRRVPALRTWTTP